MRELNDTRDLKWKKQIRKNYQFREREMFTHYAKKGFTSKLAVQPACFFQYILNTNVFLDHCFYEVEKKDNISML